MAAGGDPDRSHILRPPLIGASPPWLPPPLIHDAERWNAALCRGERGGSAADGPGSVGSGRRVPATALRPGALGGFPRIVRAADGVDRGSGRGAGGSGDGMRAVGRCAPRVLAEPPPSAPSPGGAPTARVLQLTCPPVHSSLPRPPQGRLPFRPEPGGTAARRLPARHGRTTRRTTTPSTRCPGTDGRGSATS